MRPNGNISEVDVWPDGHSHSAATVKEIFAVAKSLTPDEVRQVLPDSKLSNWYQPYYLAEQIVQSRAKQAVDQRDQAILQLQEQVKQLEAAIRSLRKQLRVVVRSDGDISDDLVEVVAQASADTRKKFAG